MNLKYFSLFILSLCMTVPGTVAQIVINEASNQNYSSVNDEDGDFPDWIELYNAGADPVDLFGYSLSDDETQSTMWTFPHRVIQPGEFLLVFCSEKNRYATEPGTLVVNSENFIPQSGWNDHVFQTPFNWDGVSNVMVNVCSFSSLGYTNNSVFNQSYTPFISTLSSYEDGSPGACGNFTGEPSTMRPNLLLNGFQIGTDIAQNCNTCYPAPYGNWYWGARTQMILHADELNAAGLSAGPINSIAFDVVSPDPQTYDFIEIVMGNVDASEFNNMFINNYGFAFHTNFKLKSDGDHVFLFAPDQTLTSSLAVDAETFDVSNGAYPDGSDFSVLFQPPTPGATNNFTEPSQGYADTPSFSVGAGFYTQPVAVQITNTNGANSSVYYTLDGSFPTTESLFYDGSPIVLTENTVLRARAFESNNIASEVAVASYFFNVNHVTPILSVVTDNNNLYGPEGIFDNFMDNWLKEAYVEYFDSIPTHPLLFSQSSGLIQDGGWGGSRSNPQHSFRLKLGNNLLGGEPMLYPVIPDRPHRNTYSDFYLRNGSNQYLVLPYKDASQVKMMCDQTNTYYSAYRPISVYINGSYFGLYELREKWNKEKFIAEDNATDETIEILSLSAYFGFILRAVEGNADNYWNALNACNQLDPASPEYLEEVDQYFDMKYYTDYIISETWMGNTDWPGNNIKIYRSDATDYRWRFCTIDLELAMLPNGWTDCNADVLAGIIGSGDSNPYVSVFNRSLQNQEYRNNFINRYADILNTAYQTERLLAVEQNFFDLTVVEMNNEYQRWGDPNNIAGQMQAFNDNHITFRDQLICRNTVIRDQIQNNFNLTDQVNVTLDVFPAGAGIVQISTIIPESLPWTGVYFNGVPVTITAIANPGFVFSHWLSENIITSAFTNGELTLNISEDDLFTAHFLGLPEPAKVVISEINYNSDITQYSGDWFELHNYGISAINMSGWKISNQYGLPVYSIPTSTILYPGDYLVFARDMNSFQTQYPDVENVIGPFLFDLSGDGGTINIENALHENFISVTYDDALPWPLIADGGGRTLELTNNTADPNLPESWFAGCMFGSPGEPYHPCPEGVVFTEINYESAPSANAGEWVEIRNVSDETVDVSNWIFKDGDDTNLFEIPSNTLLSSGEMLVLTGNEVLFETQFPLVDNHIGPFEFTLDNGGEFLRLYDAEGKLNFSMLYGSDETWPQTPNGGGYTLELIDSSAHINDAMNWMAGCLHGSPGVRYTPCTIIGIEEIIGSNQLLVYPNPVNDKLEVIAAREFSAGTEIRVTDMCGKILSMQTLKVSKKQHEVDMSSFASGWYIIETNAQEGFTATKVMKN